MTLAERTYHWQLIPTPINTFTPTCNQSFLNQKSLTVQI